MGCEVIILPTLAEFDPLRHSVLIGAKDRKNPDLKIDGVYTEISTPIDILHDRKISNCIRHSHRQADAVIIRLLTCYNIKKLERIAKGRFLSHEELKTIEFVIEGKYHFYKRSDFI